jgi:hypothetical protein
LDNLDAENGNAERDLMSLWLRDREGVGKEMVLSLGSGGGGRGGRGNECECGRGYECEWEEAEDVVKEREEGEAVTGRDGK